MNKLNQETVEKNATKTMDENGLLKKHLQAPKDDGIQQITRKGLKDMCKNDKDFTIKDLTHKLTVSNNEVQRLKRLAYGYLFFIFVLVCLVLLTGMRLLNNQNTPQPSKTEQIYVNYSLVSYKEIKDFFLPSDKTNSKEKTNGQTSLED